MLEIVAADIEDALTPFALVWRPFVVAPEASAPLGNPTTSIAAFWRNFRISPAECSENGSARSNAPRHRDKKRAGFGLSSAKGSNTVAKPRLLGLGEQGELAGAGYRCR